MSKWKLEKTVEMIPVSIDPREYQQLLADLAEILYRCFRQLDPKPIPVSKSIGTNVQPKTEGSR